MTTQAFTTRIRHDSDAVFREWGLELNTKFAAVGLVQTADTGQINWTTVTRAAANTNAGYEIWRFADAMQSTAPIYLRIDYGTGALATTARMQLTVGTGTNGSGTLTGTCLTTARQFSTTASVGFTVDTARPSYLCHTDGFLGLCWKVGATTTDNNIAAFMITRSYDSSGVATATAALVWWGSASNSAIGASQALRFAATAVAYTAQTIGPDNTMLTFLAQRQAASTLPSGDAQASLCYIWTPRMEPVASIVGIIPTEVTTGSTFTMAAVGTTVRTYIALDAAMPVSGSGTAAGGAKPAMLWE